MVFRSLYYTFIELIYSFSKVFVYQIFCISLWPEMCGEIWLLATTLKNAKMLTQIGDKTGLFHINVLCFCDGSA